MVLSNIQTEEENPPISHKKPVRERWEFADEVMVNAYNVSLGGKKMCAYMAILCL